MGKIRILSDELCNHIAAGEVVERPAAVVKELVENSIDAGATRITVNFERGGVKLVEVADNGEGMDREDALLAVERHATSKISSFRDIANITTLGFRGEALASIAAISKMTITTKTDFETTGTKIKIEGGQIISVSDAGCPTGCRIIVQDLFYNVPARKKFLKSEATERLHIQDCFKQLSLAHPDIHFRLNHAGKRLYDYPPVANMQMRIFQVLGNDAADKFCPLQKTAGSYRVYGSIADPRHSRPNSKMIYLFVNGRPVKDALLYRAIREACAGYVPEGNYPVAVLQLEMNPHLVDVNVHPTKREVRFRHPADVVAVVKEAVLEALKGFDLNLRSRKSTASAHQNHNLHMYGSPTVFEEKQETLAKTASKVLKYQSSASGAFFSSMNYLGQIDGTYIILQQQDDLVIIDFHAAHERVLYNRLSRNSLPVPGQTLLQPITFRIAPEEAEGIEKCRDILLSLGYDVDLLNHDTAVIRSVPALAKHYDHARIVEDVIKVASEESNRSAIVDSFVKALSCHRAIRSGYKLNFSEVRWLLKEMDSQEQILTCPHGRPIWLRLGSKELSKMFARSK